MSGDKLLDGRTALVTGAGQGIGKGIALALARAGCRVVVNDLTRESAQGTANEIIALGVGAFVAPADVRVAADVTAMVLRAIDRFGRLDILVNNAGVQTWKAFLDLNEMDWDRDVETNLKGCFLCTQAAAGDMKARGGGSIVNIGSGCNKIPFPQLSSYTASKGGVEMLTKVTAVELGPYGVRVNCVAPGAIEVERTKRETADYAGSWGRITPLRRIGTPADVGNAVVFLASDAASFITGQTIWVDGGLFTQPVWPRE